MDQALQLLIGGLVVGSIYGLIGIAFTGVYNVTGVVNFAQGDLAMMGAMVGAAAWSQGLAEPIAILIGILAGAILGAAMFRFGIQPLKGNLVGAVIVTIGFGIALQGMAVAVWGTDAQTLPAFSGEKPIHIGGATLPPQALWILATAIALMALLTIFFQYTYAGRAFRASSVNPLAARLCGIEARKMGMIAFVLSGALGATAGLVVAPITFTSSDIGIPLAIKGFTACVIGGLGSAVGAMIGGLLLGLIEAFSAGYLSSGYKNAIAFIVLLLFLAFRPGGILGELESTGR
jgi:branched-chain amino acid transport system permease protein